MTLRCPAAARDQMPSTVRRGVRGKGLAREGTLTVFYCPTGFYLPCPWAGFFFFPVYSCHRHRTEIVYDDDDHVLCIPPANPPHTPPSSRGLHPFVDPHCSRCTAVLDGVNRSGGYHRFDLLFTLPILTLLERPTSGHYAVSMSPGQ